MHTPLGYLSVHSTMYAAYFVNWAIYGRNYEPSQLPADVLTHIIYAFVKTNPQTGEVTLSDPWADKDKKLKNGGNGCLGELHNMKKQQRQLRVLLSIGGWTYSSDLTAAFNNPDSMRNFAKSATSLVDEFSLDGIDIDWEYPSTPQQAQQYVEVLKLCRLELDSLALRHNLPRDQFDLTIAAPAGDPRNVLSVREMDRYLTYWNLMSYDFAGSWSQVVDHQANLFGGAVSADMAVEFYLGKGVPPQKMILGMPLYGRSFANTKGMGKPFQGVAPGDFENGVNDVKNLPLKGSKEHVDSKRVGAYCEGNGVVVSYDNAETMKLKAKYVRSKHLGGGMWWESSGDRPGANSLIRTFTHELGPCQNWKMNWIKN